MFKIAIHAIAISGLLTLPALAQSPTPAGTAGSLAECYDNFDYADQNGDGVLGYYEIAMSRGVIPTILSNREAIFMQDFLSACRTTVRNQRR